MNKSEKTTFENLKRQFTDIKKELWEEETLAFPSHYTLERNAEKIIELLKITNLDNEEFEFWSSWKVRNLDIFIADLVGELHHDYEKRNKRYRIKWQNEKRTIISIIEDFNFKFSEKSIVE